MKLPIVTLEGIIGAGKTTLLQQFEESLSDTDKTKIWIDHEPIKEFQQFKGSELINPLTEFYINPKENAFVFQNYVLDVYQERLEKLEKVQTPYKLIVMDRGFDSCHLFSCLNHTKFSTFGFQYLTQRYKEMNAKFFPGRMFSTDAIFYLDTGVMEAKERIKHRNREGEDKIPVKYLEDLDSHYRLYLDFAQIEVDCCVAPTLEEGELNENNELEKLMSFVNSIIEKYEFL